MSDIVNTGFILGIDDAKRDVFLMLCDAVNELKLATGFDKSEDMKQNVALSLDNFCEKYKEYVNRKAAMLAERYGISSALVKFECDTFHDDLKALIDKLMDRDVTAIRAKAIRAARKKKKP
jgi:hypothetical protein